MSLSKSERAVVLLVAAVNFVNVLDFVMVMPLGPDFAGALGIPTSKLGIVSGSYAAAAAFTGLLGSFFLDRFDRRPALGVAMIGLVTGTAMGGLAHGFPSMSAARLTAGFFGGPATSLAMSIVADTVPNERRGAALGITMAAFSVAAVLGVPASLWLAQHAGWRTPFFTVAGMGVLITLGAIFFLPPMRKHLENRKGLMPLAHLFAQPSIRLSWTMTFATMAAGFVIIPNLPTYLQFNLGLPRSKLDTVYLYGGTLSFFSTQIGGRLIDKFGSFRVGTVASAFVLLVLWAGFFHPMLRPLPLILGFMLGLSLRNVAYNTLTSKVPQPDERARFMSIQSAVQHAASGLGAMLASLILSQNSQGALVNMGWVAALSAFFTLLFPPLARAVETRVRK